MSDIFKKKLDLKFIPRNVLSLVGEIFVPVLMKVFKPISRLHCHCLTKVSEIVFVFVFVCKNHFRVVCFCH